jgi:hypothetical protein
MREIICDSCSNVASSVPEAWSAEDAVTFFRLLPCYIEIDALACECCASVGTVEISGDPPEADLVFRTRE